ncbi:MULTISPECIES: DUF397 domain-containing protein [Streptomyces]|uniref:DUF397 domain-containing protein n=1 Tax=Streptomyces TaxID=1883 RepID=UPI0027E169DF|nr:DUF397 domain-containing protein [Streptomyces sennicomposti]
MTLRSSSSAPGECSPKDSGYSPAVVDEGPLPSEGTIRAARGIGGTAVVHEGRPLWRRSSACGNEMECLEVAVRADHVLTRDSKKSAASALHFTAPAWTGFLRAVSRGELERS